MDKLTVPANISLKKEIWRGFTYKSFGKTAVISGIVIILSVIYVKFFNPQATFTAMLAVFISMASCVTYYTTIEQYFNLSMSDYINNYIGFIKSQKTFLYKKEL